MVKKEGKQQRSMGRADLEQRLRDKGFSKREAKRALNGILEAMIQALQRGEEVEFPLGKLKREYHRHRQQEGRFLGRKATIYRRRSTVVHEMDEKGKRLLNPRPKPRLTLPPKPGEKVEEKTIERKITMRRLKKAVPRSQPVEPSQDQPKLPLPPRPGAAPGAKPVAVNRTRSSPRRLVLPPKPRERTGQ
jgi:nucleoid DNA-binding protein